MHLRNFDPTRPDPWVDPTRVHPWGRETAPSRVDDLLWHNRALHSIAR